MIGRTLDKDRLGLSGIDEGKFIMMKFGETLRLSYEVASSRDTLNHQKNRLFIDFRINPDSGNIKKLTGILTRVIP